MIVPVHKSQWGIDAKKRINDCGPACVSMFLTAIGDLTPIDQLRTGDPTGLTFASDLVRIFAEHGVQAHTEKLERLEDVKPYSILLVLYEPLRRYAQDKNFAGWHWLIGVGFEGNEYKTLDPDYGLRGLPASEGDGKLYPVAAMRSAFRPYSGSLATAVVVDGLLPMPEPTSIQGKPYRVTGDVNFRAWYSTNDRVIGSLVPGLIVMGFDRTYQNDGHTWRMVEQFGKTGWVSDKYLKPA